MTPRAKTTYLKMERAMRQLGWGRAMAWEKDCIEAVAKAIYERMFEERWDDLPENSIERALYREVAVAALNAGRAWEMARW